MLWKRKINRERHLVVQLGSKRLDVHYAIRWQIVKRYCGIVTLLAKYILMAPKTQFPTAEHFNLFV